MFSLWEPQTSQTSGLILHSCPVSWTRIISYQKDILWIKKNIVENLLDHPHLCRPEENPNQNMSGICLILRGVKQKDLVVRVWIYHRKKKKDEDNMEFDEDNDEQYTPSVNLSQSVRGSSASSFQPADKQPSSTSPPPTAKKKQKKDDR